MKKEAFHTLVRRILNEEITKRLPEMNGNGVDPAKKNRVFTTDENSRDTKSKDEMLAQIQKAMGGINEDFPVVWDDHDDIKIDARDMFSARISARWEDSYDIELFIRGEDRYYFKGLTWEQTLEFVKENLKPKAMKHTGVEKGRDKAWRNAEDQTDKGTKGLPQTDKPKVMSTDKPFSKEKNREKRYVEDQNKAEDNPDKPMREVGEFKKLTGYKVRDPVRLRKRIPDKKLVVKQK